MSINAYARRNDEPLAVNWVPTLHDETELLLTDLSDRDIFAEVRAFVLSAVDGVDSCLEIGMLGTRTAVEYLGQFLRQRQVDWTHAELLEADTWFQDHVNDFPPPMSTYNDNDMRWAYWSAREFLEACVRGGYGISFS